MSSGTIQVGNASGAIECQACGKAYSLHKNLLKHFRNKHGPVKPLRVRKNEKAESVICEFCDYKTSTKSAMQCHKKVHKTGVPQVCPLCSVKFGKQELYKHFESDHSIELREEKMEFSSESEFLSWKAKIEKDSVCYFPLKHTYTIKSDASTFRKFACHRDGVFKTHGKNMRNLKKCGSVKMGGHCPASMLVKRFQAGNVSVRFCGTHVGHSMKDIGRVRLSHQEREELAQKIASGVPFNMILDSARNSVSISADLEPRHLLTLKDLHNIKRDFNLQNNIVRHTNDFTGVESWNEGDFDFEEVVIHENPQAVQQDGLEECLIGPSSNRQSEEFNLEKAEKHLTDLFRTVLKKARKAEDITLVEEALKSLSDTLDARNRCHPALSSR